MFKVMRLRCLLLHLDVLSKLENRESRLDWHLRTYSSQGPSNYQLFIRKIHSRCEVQREDAPLSSLQFIISLSWTPSLHISHPIPLSFPPSLKLSILRHFNNSKWYIKVNEICHTSGHYDACQGFVSSVRWTAAAHQRPVLLPHHVEYWISKVLENTVAPLISGRHNLQRLTPHAFISPYNIPLRIMRQSVGRSAGVGCLLAKHFLPCKVSGITGTSECDVSVHYHLWQPTSLSSNTGTQIADFNTKLVHKVNESGGKQEKTPPKKQDEWMATGRAVFGQIEPGETEQINRCCSEGHTAREEGGD